MKMKMRSIILWLSVVAGIVVSGASFLPNDSALAQETAPESDAYAYIVYEDGSTEALTATYTAETSLKEMIAQEGSQASEEHPVPTVPVVVDGVLYEDPAVLNQLFVGQKLRFIVDDKAEEEGVVYAFTTDEGYLEYIQTYWGIDPNEPFAGSSTQEHRVNATTPSRYWEHAFYGGAR